MQPLELWVCPAFNCHQPATIQDEYDLPDYSFRGREMTVHAKVSCAVRHHHNLPKYLLKRWEE